MDCTTLGNAYLNGKAVAVSEGAKSVLEGWVAYEYSLLPFKVVYTDDVTCLPSDGVEVARLIAEGSLRVFSGGSESVWCSHETNIKFRAVHDYHHALCGSGFTFEGEIEAYKFGVERMVIWSDADKDSIIEAGKVLFSEIVMQAAAYFVLGDFPDTQKVVYL